MTNYEVVVLFDGYSRMTSDDVMEANCSCTLIKGLVNMIIDTMTPWDADKIKKVTFISILIYQYSKL